MASEEEDDDVEASRLAARAPLPSASSPLSPLAMNLGPEVASAEPQVSSNFKWTEEFETFTGKPEVYQRNPGPISISSDPGELFKFVWDQTIMREIVEQTNLYARQKISRKITVDGGDCSILSSWEDTTIDELYRLFSVIIYMSHCERGVVGEYWTTGILGMPEFRKIMSRNRFTLLMGMVHFINNSFIPSDVRTYERKMIKIYPLFEHCNKKFGQIYVPQRELSLDESLLLWKGSLSWAQTIRSKAARCGIKSFDLCEARTGYLLKSILYGGKDSSGINSVHGFENSTAKTVLKLMEGYLDQGHLLVMDSWYNQLALTRYLKTRSTDVLGTLNCNRLNAPSDIKALSERKMVRGQMVSRHCGDISVVAWKDCKLVTILSTYHTDKTVSIVGRRTGEEIIKPEAIDTYNKFMGGVDRKDQMLSQFVCERSRGNKWYIKVFRRLINISLLNTYIVYTRNACERKMTHRQYRYAVCERLLAVHKREVVSRPILQPPPLPKPLYPCDKLRLDRTIPHYLVPCMAQENFVPGLHQRRFKRRRCVRCSKQGKQKTVASMCNVCKVGLCMGTCFIDYHELQHL
ncbi:piggyBac transposable element-derived protein 4-like [Aphomia sociella]